MNTEIIPIPQAHVSIRDATPADVAFIDALQKLHGEQLGFMRTSWIEEKINKNEVIVAQDQSGRPVGYCMGVDKYSGRQDVGIIHQLSVEPGRQRGFVGATLLKAMFDRAAYGCRLFCCWCAQDIEANHFWEAMGFVALAYRAGSEKKKKGGRVHIYWQKRIRQGDDQTPWWFPSETRGGAMGEARLVLPIPPGKRWSDELPLLLPADVSAAKRLPAPRKARQKKPAPSSRPVLGRGVTLCAVAPKPVEEKKPRDRKPKRKNDPKLVAAARELRDRWLEHVNANPSALTGAGKYDVSRAPIESTAPARSRAVADSARSLLLPAA